MNSVPKYHGTMGRMNVKYQLRQLEMEAYHAVLIAFVAQSDTISWDKEGLITELRKELNVTDIEHREFLTKIDSNISVKRIRDWRKGVSDVQEPDYGGNKISRSAGHTRPKKSIASHSVGRRQTSQRYESHEQIYSAEPACQQYASYGKYSISTQYEPDSSGSKYQKYASNAKPPLPTLSSKYTSHGEPYVVPHTSQKYASHGQLYSAACPSPTPIFTPTVASQKNESSRHEHHRVDRLGKLIVFPMGKGGYSLSIAQASSMSKGGKAGESHSNDLCTPDDRNVSKKAGLLRVWETKKLLFEVEKMVNGTEYPDTMLIEKAKRILEEHERSILDVLAELSNVSDEDNPPNQAHRHYYNKDLQGTW